MKKKSVFTAALVIVLVFALTLALAACDTGGGGSGGGSGGAGGAGGGGNLTDGGGGTAASLGTTINKTYNGVSNSTGSDITFTRDDRYNYISDVCINSGSDVEVKLSKEGVFTLKLSEVRGDRIGHPFYFCSLFSAGHYEYPTGASFYSTYIFNDDGYMGNSSISWREGKKNIVILMYANIDSTIKGNATLSDSGITLDIDITLKKGWNTVICNESTRTLKSGVSSSSYKWTLTNNP
jgi:hypothetical protein